ncbi:MAG TPA: Clp protease N-terminal domain-containing protein [Arthrobacter sp.]
MFERFTEDAIRVVDLAHVEAEAMHHQRISPVHFLVALTHTDGAAKTALTSLGVTTGSAREAAVEVHGPGVVHDGSIYFTPATHTLISNARHVRHRMGDRLVTPVHLLFGLTMLETYTEGLYPLLGVTPAQVQAALCAMIESSDDYTPADAREVMARIGSPAPADVYIVRTADDDEASLHLDFDEAVQAAGDSGSVTDGRITLRHGEFFSIRDHSYVRDDLRYLDYATARDVADSAGAHVCLMIPFTRDVKAVTAGGSEVAVGATTAWSATDVERRVTVLGQ